MLDKFPKGEIYIILIRLDDCEIPYNKLEDIHYVDMFPNWEVGLKSIFQSIGVGSDESLETKIESRSQQTGEKKNNKNEINIPSSDIDYDSISEETKCHERLEAINTYKHEPMFRENIVENGAELFVYPKCRYVLHLWNLLPWVK